MEDSLEALRRLAEQCVSSKGKVNIQEATSNGLLKLLQLKEESRKLTFKAEDQREDTSKCKTRLEQAHLQLQNLLYEKGYYAKEISECQNFRFKHADKAIGLVPVEQFLQNASPEVQARIGDDPHKLMLERLRDELFQRKAMVARLEELRKAKAAKRQEVDKRRRTLEDLQQQLQGLEDTAKPLQTILAPHLSLRGFARSADLLPLPLYIVYSQLAAVREALGMPIRVAILGSSVEAESFAKSQTQEPADIAADTSANASARAASASALGSSTEPASKIPRLSPAPPYAASVSAGGGPSPTPPASTDELYKVHPLSVLLEVQRENATGRLQTFISVKFQFLVNLRLVTAHSDIRDDNMLLAALFPGDDGSGTAFEGLAQLQGGTFKFDTSRPAKPYRWCQDLAGLDFAPALPLASQLQAGQPEAVTAGVVEGLDAYRRQQRVVHVIERLRAVKMGDEALKKILPALDKNPNPPNISSYPKLPASMVVSVEEIKAQPSAVPSTAVGVAAAKGSARSAIPSRLAAAAAAAGPSGGAAAAPGGGVQAPSAGPAQGRADASMEDGELGRRATSAAGGALIPAPDAPAAEAASSAGNAAAVPSGAQHGTAAAAATAGDEALEDGEAAMEEGEDHHRDQEDHMEVGEGADGRDSAADQLIARYLLTDVTAPGGDAAGGPGSDGSRRAAAPKPVSRLYRLVVRHKVLECEVLVRVYLEYPVRPPLLLVKAVREVARDRRTAPRVVQNVNLVAWLEAEANSAALSRVPPEALNYTLLYQLLHLRLAFDEFAVMYLAENTGAPGAGATAGAAVAAAVSGTGAAGNEDLVALMASRQRVRGRDRRVLLPVLSNADV